MTNVVEERLCQESLTLEEGALLAQVPICPSIIHPLFLLGSFFSCVVPSDAKFQVLELGVQLSVLLGCAVSNLEELLTWTEAELLRVTSGDTDMQQTRAQVCRHHHGHCDHHLLYMQVSLAQRCLSNTCTLASSCLAIGSADVEFTEKLVNINHLHFIEQKIEVPKEKMYR